MFTSAATVFNIVEFEDSISYPRTLIPSVLAYTDDTDLLLRTGVVGQGLAKFYIPINTAVGREYIPAADYTRLSKVGSVNGYTFRQGDYIGVGDIDLEDLTPSKYRENYGKIYEIVAVTEYRMGRLANWLVVAK